MNGLRKPLKEPLPQLKCDVIQADITTKYDVHEEIGRGKFAVVKRCIHKVTGTVVAAKFIRKKRRGRSCRDDILREVVMLELAVTHPRLVDLIEVYESTNEIVIVMEYCCGGELFHECVIEESFTEPDVARFTRQIVEGLVFLHERCILHLDLKPQNVLLTKPFPEGDVKLCDFGFSCLIRSGEDVREIIGTPDYVAPEVLNYERLTLATDMWSLGVMTYVMLTACSPFVGDTQQETYCNITIKDIHFPESLFADKSPLCIDFIERLVQKSPKERMTAVECLQHPWLASQGQQLCDDIIFTNEISDEISSKKHKCDSVTDSGVIYQRERNSSESDAKRHKYNVSSSDEGEISMEEVSVAESGANKGDIDATSCDVTHNVVVCNGDVGFYVADNIVTDSTHVDPKITPSTISDVVITDATIKYSTKTDLTILDSTNMDSTVTDSIVTDSTVKDSIGTNNVSSDAVLTAAIPSVVNDNSGAISCNNAPTIPSSDSPNVESKTWKTTLKNSASQNKLRSRMSNVKYMSSKFEKPQSKSPGLPRKGILHITDISKSPNNDKSIKTPQNKFTRTTSGTEMSLKKENNDSYEVLPQNVSPIKGSDDEKNLVASRIDIANRICSENVQNLGDLSGNLRRDITFHDCGDSHEIGTKSDNFDESFKKSDIFEKSLKKSDSTDCKKTVLNRHETLSSSTDVHHDYNANNTKGNDINSSNKNSDTYFNFDKVKCINYTASLRPQISRMDYETPSKYRPQKSLSETSIESRLTDGIPGNECCFTIESTRICHLYTATVETTAAVSVHSSPESPRTTTLLSQVVMPSTCETTESRRQLDSGDSENAGSPKFRGSMEYTPQHNTYTVKVHQSQRGVVRQLPNSSVLFHSPRMCVSMPSSPRILQSPRSPHSPHSPRTACSPSSPRVVTVLAE